VNTPQVICRRTDPGEPHQEFGDAFELVEKACRKPGTAFRAVEGT